MSPQTSLPGADSIAVWHLNYDAQTGQLTVQNQLQQWNPDEGRMDTVLGGEMTASLERWKQLATRLVDAPEDRHWTLAIS